MTTVRGAVLAIVGVWLIPAAAGAQAVEPPLPQTGAEMYRAWCAVCHSVDGTGRGAERPVKTPPLDFTNCRMTTPEPDADWRLVLSHGGPAAGLSSEMPSFEMLNADQIDRLVVHLRSFCIERGWPTGNMNVRRALFTAKAFPESEAVLVPMVSHGPDTYPRLRVEAEYAARLGKRGQIEVGVPAEAVGWVTGPVAGVGDISFGAKVVAHYSETRPWLLSSGVKIEFPTGSRRWGFGEGTVIVEPFVAVASLWKGFTLQGDFRGQYYERQIPNEPYRHAVYNVAVSRDLSIAPSAWTLGIEVNGFGGAVGLTPYVAKGITRTGSLTAAFGVRVPVRVAFPFNSDRTRWTGYLLWDYTEPFRARK